MNKPEFILTQKFVKVNDDLIQEPQTLDALVVPFELDIKFGKVCYRREHDTNVVALFVVNLVHVLVASQKVVGDVDRENVREKLSVVGLKVFHVFFLFYKLRLIEFRFRSKSTTNLLLGVSKWSPVDAWFPSAGCELFGQSRRTTQRSDRWRIARCSGTTARTSCSLGSKVKQHSQWKAWISSREELSWRWFL